MKHVAWLVVLVVSGVASAGAPPRIETALGSGDAGNVEAVLAERVELAAVAFRGEECSRRFAKPMTVQGADRHELAVCLADAYLQPTKWFEGAWSNDTMMVAISIQDGKIVALKPVATDGNDAALPTFVHLDAWPDFTPSAKLRGAIATSKDKATGVVVKSCWRGKGTPTSRIVRSSPVAGFDAEASRYLAKHPRKRDDFQYRGHAVASCYLWRIAYPKPQPKEIVQPVKVESTGDAGPVEGGVEGGQ